MIDAESREPREVNGAGLRPIDEWECQQVVLRFTAHFDVFEHEEMERYFAPDGVWYQALGPICGIEELRARMRGLSREQVMRHVLTNLRTTFISDDESAVDSYFTVYHEKWADGQGTRESPMPTYGPRNIGRYHDRLRRIVGRWLIYERRVTFDLRVQNGSTGG